MRQTMLQRVPVYDVLLNWKKKIKNKKLNIENTINKPNRNWKMVNELLCMHFSACEYLPSRWISFPCNERQVPIGSISATTQPRLIRRCGLYDIVWINILRFCGGAAYTPSGLYAGNYGIHIHTEGIGYSKIPHGFSSQGDKNRDMVPYRSSDYVICK